MKSQENQIVVVIKVILCLIIGVLYASWLSDLPDFLFRDRNNYYIYAAYPIERWVLITKTWSSIFFKEPLFVLLNLLLQWIFLDPFQTIRYIVFFVAFAVSYFVLYRSKNILFGMIVLIMLFFQSQILALQVVTIRQGVGLAIILWVLPYLKKRQHIVLLFSICGLFHNSFFLLAFFYVIYWVIFFKLKIKIQNVRYFMFIISGVVFFSTFYLITQLVETKQSFEEESLNVGGGAFILWGAVFAYLILFKRHDLRHSEWSGNNFYEISIIGLVIYLTGYFLAPVSGRMIGIFVPFIFLLLFFKFKARDLIFISFITLVNFYLYFNGVFENFLTVPMNIFHKFLLKLY